MVSLSTGVHLTRRLSLAVLLTACSLSLVSCSSSKEPNTSPGYATSSPSPAATSASPSPSGSPSPGFARVPKTETEGGQAGNDKRP